MIYPASRDDIPTMLTLLQMHYNEHTFDWSFDPVRLSMTLMNAIEADDWLALTGDGALLLASAYESPMGAGRLAVEHIVRTARPGQFRELLAAYEAWAREQGCRTVSLGCVRRHNSFARLYSRHGYSTAETIFAKAL